MRKGPQIENLFKKIISLVSEDCI